MATFPIPAQISALRSAFPMNRKNLAWIGLFLISFAVLVINDIPFLNPHHPYRFYHVKVAPVLVPHMILGCIAIFAGPFQFSTRLRARYPKYHRLVGRAYVGSIMIAAPMGALIPIVGPKDPFYTTGVIVHATSWFVTTLMAFFTARNRQIPQHKQWMVRSYVLTYSFVITRVLGVVWQLLGVTITQFGMIDCILNFLYILCADIGLNWKEITTSRAVPVKRAV